MCIEMDALLIGFLICLCLTLVCVGVTWMKYQEGAQMELMNTTFAKIKMKTPEEAMPIVRNAYPGKTVRVFEEDIVIPKQYWREDAVHLFINTDGVIRSFQTRDGGAVL